MTSKNPNSHHGHGVDACDPNTDSIKNLHETLTWLSNHPYPHVAGPDSIKKRASVALIVRIQPAYAHWPQSNSQSPPVRDLDAFFAQDWVKHGEPEVLFIKRAARKGDRWTSHVALPGGKRDPEDADDQQAAVRETAEEVGLDLSEDTSIAVGNLPQRIVTTSFGKTPLMVLCPYIFLLTHHDTPPLRLQPTEVASTHWVPIPSLLDPRQRTVSLEDVSSRLAHQETGVKRLMLRAMLGKMVFSAIQLLPNESLHCFNSPAPHTEQVQPTLMKNFMDILRPSSLSPSAQHQPLILWGLTLGVMTDFLDLLPPHNALELWSFPTFTAPDVRLAIWCLTYSFRKAKRQEIEYRKQTMFADGAGQDESGFLSPSEEEQYNEVGLCGLGSGQGRLVPSVQSAVGPLLEGYYARLRTGVTCALVVRAMEFSAVAAWVWSRYGQKLSDLWRSV